MKARAAHICHRPIVSPDTVTTGLTPPPIGPTDVAAGS